MEKEDIIDALTEVWKSWCKDHPISDERNIEIFYIELKKFTGDF